MVDEIEALQKEVQFKKIDFCDNNFNAPKNMLNRSAGRNRGAGARSNLEAVGVWGELVYRRYLQHVYRPGIP